MRRAGDFQQPSYNFQYFVLLTLEPEIDKRLHLNTKQHYRKHEFVLNFREVLATLVYGITHSVYRDMNCVSIIFPPCDFYALLTHSESKSVDPVWFSSKPSTATQSLQGFLHAPVIERADPKIKRCKSY